MNTVPYETCSAYLIKSQPLWIDDHGFILIYRTAWFNASGFHITKQTPQIIATCTYSCIM